MDFAVYPEQLRQQGRAIEDLGAGSADELGALHEQTATGGSTAWGSDISGATIGGIYQDLASSAGDALDLLTSVMQTGGTGVQSMADRYQGTEEANQSRFEQIRGELA